MTQGKKTCKILKEIRQQIADKNDIEYITSECHFQGGCKGTCPKCESEVRYLENELSKRQQLGKAVAIAGISLGVIGSFSACDSSTQKRNKIKKQNNTSDTTSFIPEILVGDISDEGINIPNTTKKATNIHNKIAVEGLLDEIESEHFDEINTYTTGLIVSKEPITKNDDDLFLATETEPEYPGGLEELSNFLKDNVIYPRAAKENKTEGRVFIKFIIEKDGSISNTEVLRDIGFGCGEEALRVVKLMPKWKPAEDNGKLVRFQYLLPIVFKEDTILKTNIIPSNFSAEWIDEVEEEEGDFFMGLIVETMPEYPSGEKELKKFLADNIIYPTAAKDNKIEGRVFVRFVVEKDGSISNTEILRDIGFGCGEEALRVVKLMPKWKPAEQRGKPVRTEMNIPVVFKLED